MPFAHDAPKRFFSAVDAVAHDKEGRFDVFLLERIENAPRDDGARSVVEGEVDALFLGIGKGGGGERHTRAEMCRQNQQCGEKNNERNVLFLHIFSLGNFYKNIYIFP